MHDLLPEHGTLLLVVPLDSGAPQGRLILPQVQTIRDSLDGRCLCLVVTEEQLPQAFAALREPPDLVVCDSQVVHVAARLTPPSVPLTTFSILMARAKGDLVDGPGGGGPDPSAARPDRAGAGSLLAPCAKR